MNKIIRRPDRAEGGLTADERRKMEQHTAMWIARAMRTDPIEPDKITPAIHALYAAADLPAPRVVIVPSPIVGAFAYGAAAAIWCARKTGEANSSSRAATEEATRAATDAATRAATWVATDEATRAATRAATWVATDAATRAATEEATRAATDAATRAATRAATWEATRAATEEATWVATDAATRAATRAATWVATRAATGEATRAATRAATEEATWVATGEATDEATRAATRAATWVATDAATRAATEEATDAATEEATACRELAGEMGIACAAQWRRSYQGGNMWSSFDCYLTAARDILGLDLPEHEKYAAWEQCAIHGGFRFLHPEFCIVSDFPAVLRVDEQNRPHCETGPSHLWRDGTAQYYWHGVKIPGEWIEDRASLTPQIALSQTNADARAAAIQIIGWQRMTDALGAKVVDRHPEGMAGGELLAVEKSKVVAGERGTMKLLRAECPRNGPICFRVPDSIQTAHEAQAWSRGLPPEIFRLPSTRT